jgi:amino acid transporter
MENRFHGVFMLSLLGGAGVVGLVAILLESFVLSLIYLAVLCAALLIIVYCFCGKCLCRLDACVCIFPGELSKHLPERKGTNYTLWDIGAVFILLSAIALFPQYWLFKRTILLVIFWLLFVGAHTEIMLVVCRRCGNERCPMFKRIHKK